MPSTLTSPLSSTSHWQLRKWRRPARWAGAALALSLLALWAGTPGAQAWLLQALPSLVSHLTGGTTLPNWSIYLLSGCALAGTWQLGHLGQLGRLGKARPLRKREPQPLDYRKDSFLNVQWEWTYDEHERPKGLWSACPDCATRLVAYVTKPPEERRTKLFCEHCRKTLVNEPGDRDYLLARVARQVERKRRTGQWKDSQSHEAAQHAA